MNTPTPETDNFITSQGYSPTDYQWRNFTRKLECERDEAQYNLENARQSLEVAIEEIKGMKKAILETLEQNRNLADGDDCTLYRLKSVIEFWE
jgi:hypothetical protein